MNDQYQRPACLAPDRRSPPGETIADILEERGATAADRAAAFARPEGRVAQLLQGDLPIDGNVAGRLEQTLRAPARFPLASERRYRRSTTGYSHRQPR